jgi:hypothetical protein
MREVVLTSFDRYLCKLCMGYCMWWLDNKKHTWQEICKLYVRNMYRIFSIFSLVSSALLLQVILHEVDLSSDSRNLVWTMRKFALWAVDKKAYTTVSLSKSWPQPCVPRSFLRMTHLVTHGPPQQQCFLSIVHDLVRKFCKEMVVFRWNKVAVGVAHAFTSCVTLK